MTPSRPRPDLTRLLDPASIAIVGASSNPGSISAQPLRYMLASGYAGRLYPVNPNRAEVLGVAAFADVRSVPRPCDVAVIAVAARHVPAALLQCGEAGIPYAVVLTAGFAETGEAGMAMQRELDAAIAASGVRVVGPNCVGVMNVAKRAWCAFGGALSDPSLRPGPLAIVSQSGGFGQSIMTMANAQGVGSTYVVSCGNEADLTFFDFAHDFLDRDDVAMVAAYMEATTEGLRLRELGRHALAVGKPILMMKVGNAGAARRAAQSHSGKLTGDVALFRAAFAEGGFIEVNDLFELADVARLVVGGRRPAGRRVAIFTGSGGWGVIMAEQCEKAGLEVPPPSPAFREKLRGLDSTFSSIENPIDIMANYADLPKAVECLLDDPAYDQFLVRSPGSADIEPWTGRMLELASRTDKPILINWAPIPSRYVAERERLEAAGLLCANYASRAARAAGAYTGFCLRQAAAAARPPAVRPLPPQALALPGGESCLSEVGSRAAIARYGIPATAAVTLPLADVLALERCPLPWPVAVKLVSPDIAHKSEAGAVRLAVRSLEELKAAAEAVHAGGLRHAPQARVEGISIQAMASGVEVLMGAVADPDFGPYVMVGLGGVFAEALQDVSHRYAPIEANQAREMIAELRGARLLDGFRGRGPADVDALIDALVRLSWLIHDHADRIAEVDVNPVFVGERGRGLAAADALVVLKGGSPA